MNTSSKIRSHLLDFVYQFYTEMRSHEIIIAYEGDISHLLMKSLASVVEDNMIAGKEASLVRQRVYHVMVECLQNITHHAFRDEKMQNLPAHNILLVTRTDGQYHVITGNPVHVSKTGELKNMIDKINVTEDERLDEMYKKQLVKGKIAVTGGAGLGFIDIRRKTGSLLGYHFLPIDDRFSFFLLDSVIPGKT